MDLRSYTRQNRIAWNEIAGPRQAKCVPAQFFRDGKATVEPEEVEALGDVTGQRVLHLQCASGNESLSWAVLGARVTAVDISDVAIEIARKAAEEADLDVRFVVSDVFALPPDLQDGSFDIVVASGGVLCWAPDVNAWARVAAAAARRGGRVMLADLHPLMSCVWVEEDGRMRLTGEYFSRTAAVPGTDLGKLACDAPSSETHYSFCWPIGDIVTAFVNAGLHILRLEEFSGPVRATGGGEPTDSARDVLERLPRWFILLAEKPDVTGQGPP